MLRAKLHCRCNSARLLEADSRRHAQHALPKQAAESQSRLSRGVHAGERIEGAGSAVLRIPCWSAVYCALQ